MLSEQLDLFGDRPKSPRPPSRVKELIEPPMVDDIQQTEPQAPPVAIVPPQEMEVVEATEHVAVIEPDTLPDLTSEADMLAETEERLPTGAMPEPEIAEEIEEAMVSEEDFDVSPGIVPEVVEELPLAEAMATETVEEQHAWVESNEPAETEVVPDTPAETMDETESSDTAIDWSKGELNIPPDKELFQRQYYTMRETTAMFSMTHAQLRNWENEFDILQPRKNRKGDRYFRPVDIKNLELIYYLLRKRKFTPDGAKAWLKNNKKALDNFGLIQKLEGLKSFLIELKANL